MVPESTAVQQNFADNSLYQLLRETHSAAPFQDFRAEKVSASSDAEEVHTAARVAGCPHIAKYKPSASSTQPSLVGREATGDKTVHLHASFVKGLRTLIQYSLVLERKSRRTLKARLVSIDGNAITNGNGVKRRKISHEVDTPTCSKCQLSIGRVHACLHCVFYGCYAGNHIQDHLSTAHHTFALDLGRRLLYCQECKDYIYDIELEGMIIQPEIARYHSKHRKPSDTVVWWKPSRAEMDQVKTDGSLIHCEGIRGISNMGNTCFMSVILQSFAHNPLVKAHFLADKHNAKRCTQKHCMCCEMDDMFVQLYSGNHQPWGPTSFLQTMWSSSKELAGYAQQDAHEFFISALNTMHSHSYDRVAENCQCVVHSTFAGLLQSDVTCLNCGNVTTAFDPFLDVSLDLRNTGKKAMRAHVPSGQNGHAAPREILDGNTLVDCLERYTSSEELGQDEYICSKCGSTFQRATKQLSVKKLPSVLSFQLKACDNTISYLPTNIPFQRFEHGTSAHKIETKIHFPEHLNMEPFITSVKRRNSSANVAIKDGDVHHPSYGYSLFAVVNHQGKMDTGHYTMYARHRGNWYRFDDHQVTLANRKVVLDSKVYMCFYIKDSLQFEDGSTVQKSMTREETA
ncbi:hypothetical protein BZG36_04094 [Bifiguratus adelaidae]|uniref:Ubiquitin carboxyl-terminal hydrolase n=1 Tax=Bifiguratus adelaidae TaxID=1938954 RepID=A0A261XVR0_9FUNG|nr:hypothetical protein BZG36_04094 [Bifiguratus adelaidae]